MIFQSKSWLEAFGAYTKPISIRMFFLGFSAGLPLLLVLGTLSFWLREAGIDLRTIGFMSWVGLIYACKWLWAPLVDNLSLPFLTKALGQRRAWLSLSQTIIIASLIMMGLTNPSESIRQIIIFASITAFASATQDIALDAYRIESAEINLQGVLAACYQTGYRLAMIWAGAGALALAAFFQNKINGPAQVGWSITYFIMAASIGVGLLTTLLSPPPNKTNEKIKELQFRSWQNISDISSHNRLAPAFFLSLLTTWFKRVWLSPLTDFYFRFRWKLFVILLFVATYRISDVVMGVMSNPFYLDMGFSKEEIAAISKIFGVIMTLTGTFVGGIAVLKLGIYPCLFLGSLLSAATNLLFAQLSTMGHDVSFLIVTVSADNLSGGLASAAFIAYLSGLTNVKYSATQYAVLSSLMLILPKFLAGFSGLVIEKSSYFSFFVFSTLLGLPALLLVIYLWKNSNKIKFSGQ